MTKKDESSKDVEAKMIDGATAEPSGNNILAVMNVNLQVDVIMGRAEIPLGVLMSMSKGAVVELDRRMGDKVDLVVNGKVIAYGKLVAMSDDKVGVEMTEIVRNFSSFID